MLQNVHAQVQLDATGSGNAFAVTYPAIIQSAPNGGIEFTFKANHSITGAATLNLNSTGAKPIYKNFNKPLETNDIITGQFVKVIYDNSGGGSWQMLSKEAMPQGNVSGSGVNGAVPFWTGTNTQSADAANFFWDNTNKRLGIGTNTPTSQIHAKGVGDGTIFIQRGANTNAADMVFTNATGTLDASHWQYGMRPVGEGNSFKLANYPSGTYTPRVTVLSTGEVGIGTISPNALLHVQGNSTTTGIAMMQNARLGALANGVLSVNGAGDMVLAPSGASLSGSGTNGAVNFWTGTSTQSADASNFFWDNTNKRLGIGTNVPQRQFHLSATALPSIIWDETGQAADERIWGMNANNGIFYGFASNDAYSATSNWLEVRRVGGSITRVNFPTGNVGIGVTNPNGKVDIAGGGAVVINGGLVNASSRPAVSTFRITGEIGAYSLSAFNADDGFLRVSAGGGLTGIKSYIDLSASSSVADMDRNIVFGTNGSEKMRILSNGNVGIASATPITALDVNGKILSRNRFSLSRSEGLDPITSKVWNIDNTNNDLRFYQEPNITTSGSVKMTLLDDGRLNLTNELNLPNGVKLSDAGGNVYLGNGSPTPGSDNITIGNTSGGNGNYNIFMGINTGNANSSGVSNVFLGRYAGESNVDGSSNIYIGNGAAAIANVGGSNIAIGDEVAQQLAGGSNNIFLGARAGNGIDEGTDNIAIGNNAIFNVSNISNSAVIGRGANISASNQMVIGNGSGYEMEVGIAVEPTARLDVGGNMRVRDLAGAGTRFVTADNNGYLGVSASTFVTSSASSNRIPYMTSSSTIGNSPIQSDGSWVGIGVAPSANYLFRVDQTSSTFPAVYGNSNVAGGVGVWGYNSNASGNGTGVRGVATGDGYGVYADNTNVLGYALYATGRGYFGGNVGIGTSTPNAPLQFSNAAANRKIVIFESLNNNHQFMGLGHSSGIFRFQIDNDVSDFVFYTGMSAVTSNELFRIKGNGNVGIGIANPNASLSIARGTGTDGTAAFSGTTHVSYFNYQTNEETFIRGGKTGSKIWVNDSHNGDVLLVAGGGRVGIGVGISVPSALLHVKGTSPLAIIDANAASQQSSIVFAEMGTTRWQVGKQTNNSFFIYDQANSRDVIQINTNSNIHLAPTAGNVAIGHNAPNAKLDVLGQMYSRAFNAGASTSIDWNNGNVQYTSANPSAYTFINMQDGGIYQLISTSNVSGTNTFSQAGLTFVFANPNGLTLSGQPTRYTFTRFGTTVYVEWQTIGSNYVAGQLQITGGSPGAGKVLTSDAAGLASWQNPPAPPVNMAVYLDQKANGTNGDVPTNNTWTTRTINTDQLVLGTAISRAGNLITLQPGKYKIHIISSASTNGGGNPNNCSSRLRLVNNGTSATVLTGMNAYSNFNGTGFNTNIAPMLDGLLDIGASTTYRVEQIINSNTAMAFGYAQSFTSTPEIYMIVEIQKLD
ncbi:MAG: hypothetical protein NW207_11320 [Cytophagales bacterium]|nr:hypothetical protein [Cytophagales bacterium]